jgi:hypothetical protein
MTTKVEAVTRSQKYIKDIKARLNAEVKWRKKAQDVMEIYECKDTEEIPFNILYANTEIIAPAIYSILPKPIVKRRYDDADPVGKKASEVAERLLEFMVNNPDPDYESVDSIINKNVRSALVPGRGVARIKYDAEIYESKESDEPGEVSKEVVCAEEIPWDRLVIGYGRSWKDVPFIAIQHFLSKEDLEELLENILGDEKKVKIPTDLKFSAGNEALKSEKAATGATEIDIPAVASVYEVWDKKTKTVVFVADGCKDIIAEVDDPLNVQGFFPMPEPLHMFKRISSMIPQILYSVYEQQAKELNSVSVRIRKIIAALKVRGFVDTSIPKMAELFKMEDNTLLALEGTNHLEGGGLDKAIWLMPVEKLVTVLQQLYVQRTQIKAIIQELSGIADIQRGNTAASETLGAQRLKSEWGSIRIKKYQKEVNRYIVELYRIMAEVAVQSLQIGAISKMTGIDLPTNEQKQQAAKLLQVAQAQIQQKPELQQNQDLIAKVEQAKVLATAITWEDVIGILRNDFTRNFRISIETNSTLELEYSDDKEQISEFLNAMAQFMNGVAPMVENGTLPFGAAKAMMLAVARRYRFGDEVEKELEQMSEPKPKDDPREGAIQQKQQQDAQLHEMELQKRQQEAQLQQQEMAAKTKKLQMEEKVAEAEFQAKMMDIARQNQLSQAKLDAQLQKIGTQNATIRP